MLQPMALLILWVSLCVKEVAISACCESIPQHRGDALLPSAPCNLLPELWRNHMRCALDQTLWEP